MCEGAREIMCVRECVSGKEKERVCVHVCVFEKPLEEKEVEHILGCLWGGACMYVCEKERESMRKSNRECVCERETECVCEGVCMRKRERERVCVCMCA